MFDSALETTVESHPVVRRFVVKEHVGTGAQISGAHSHLLVSPTGRRRVQVLMRSLVQDCSQACLSILPSASP